MAQWQKGQIAELLDEAVQLQDRLKSRKPMSQDQLSSTFAKLMFVGKVNAALRLLDQQRSFVRDMTLKTQAELDILHPEPAPLDPESLITGPFPKLPHSIIFDSITADAIKSSALKTKNSGGPSGADAEAWRRRVCSFGTASQSLLEAMALVAKRLCTEAVDPTGIAALLAARLVPLSKGEGTRPVAIGEVLRRIIGKTIMTCLRDEVAVAAGMLNLSAGQKAGAEAIVHAMTEIFEQDETDALLLVDGTSAFQLLNRRAAIHNIRHLCPEISLVVINFYRVGTRLFAIGIEYTSAEGTAQGCSIAMTMYALAVVPLAYGIGTWNPEKNESDNEDESEHDDENDENEEEKENESIELISTPVPTPLSQLTSFLPAPSSPTSSLRAFSPSSIDSQEIDEEYDWTDWNEAERRLWQAWFADDAQAAGKLRRLRIWWDRLVEHGPPYGYHPNAQKTVLIVKEHLMDEAQRIFDGTGVKIISGSRDLGAAIGSEKFKSEFMEAKVSKWAN